MTTPKADVALPASLTPSGVGMARALAGQFKGAVMAAASDLDMTPEQAADLHVGTVGIAIVQLLWAQREYDLQEFGRLIRIATDSTMDCIAEYEADKIDQTEGQS